jgi:Asp-tRNA(Asn)/Glu-tRNA(Gln) amidotransferase A subunit family amidase
VTISHTRDTVGPMGRTVGDVALLDAIITGDPPIFAAASLSGLRIGIPASFWAGLDPQVADVMSQARARLTSAGVTFVEVDTVGLGALNEKGLVPDRAARADRRHPGLPRRHRRERHRRARDRRRHRQPRRQGRVRRDPGRRRRAGYTDAIRSTGRRCSASTPTTSPPTGWRR